QTCVRGPGWVRSFLPTLLIQRVGDVVARNGRGVLDGGPTAEDPLEHRAEDVPVLDVDPGLRLRNEPALARSTLVDARAEQARRVRDVALRAERGHGRVVRGSGDPRRRPVL